MRKNHDEIPLFQQYPRLKESLPYISLGDFPTPIKRLDRLGGEIGVKELYIKLEGSSGREYGGNKVRKLEFLLGEALEMGAEAVMTFGGAGSNHALATAIYARQVGLKSILMLGPQPKARSIQRNLLRAYVAGAELHYYPDYKLVPEATQEEILRHTKEFGKPPYVIPMGGSSPLGILGFVNAAFELLDQVEAGKMPEPDYIYVAAGTLGTAIGIILGLKATTLKSRVIPVRVTPEEVANSEKMLQLFRETRSLLDSRESSFSSYDLDEQDMGLRHDFYGGEYGLYTQESVGAISRLAATEEVHIEGTYTGKAFAALLEDAKKGVLKDKVVLFWNTYNSVNFSETIAGIDYHVLPQPFHPYFEDKVQPLDKGF